MVMHNGPGSEKPTQGLDVLERSWASLTARLTRLSNLQLTVTSQKQKAI